MFNTAALFLIGTDGLGSALLVGAAVGAIYWGHLTGS